jgi:hypothetical protein
MKFNTGKFYDKLASNFNFYLYQTLYEDHIQEKNIFKIMVETSGTHILRPERFLRSLKVVEVIEQRDVMNIFSKSYIL